MTRAPFLAALCLAGCNAAERSGPANEQRAEPRKEVPAPRASGPCEGPIMSEMLDRCAFGPEERFSGVWVTGFERSEFAAGGNGA